ncbi:MAG: hypothetical protein ACREOY_10080 [Candidatus Dormibacteraceae bacterium]
MAVTLVVGAVVVAAFNSLHGTPPATLWPAKVPPAVGLCTVGLSDDQNGDVSPLFCPSGEINTLAWSYFAQEQLGVMALGPHVTPTAVKTAVEQDLKTRASATRECSAAMLAAAYYGWGFHIQPTNGLRTDCPIQGQF